MSGASHSYTLSFGRVLRGHRLRQGYSQEELAHQVGLDRTYISMLERGLRQPTLSTIVRLSEALDMRPEDLVADSGRGDWQR